MAVNVRIPFATVSANDSTPSATAWVPLDLDPDSGFAVSFAIAGACGRQYRVQHTLDNVFDRDVMVNTSGSPYPLVHSEATAVQADFAGNYTTPVRAIRLQRTSVVGTVSGRASATFFVNQAG